MSRERIVSLEFESLGSLVVSFLLFATAAGIGQFYRS